jgi:hypothetical protein
MSEEAPYPLALARERRTIIGEEAHLRALMKQRKQGCQGRETKEPSQRRQDHIEWGTAKITDHPPQVFHDTLGSKDGAFKKGIDAMLSTREPTGSTDPKNI